MNKQNRIAIIGAGVSGLSTALLLCKEGYEVDIISAHDPSTFNLADPEFSSMFPAASIIPHSVFSKKTTELFKNSQDFFKKLFEESFPGMSTTQHYELQAHDAPLPSYKDEMKDFETIDQFRSEFHPSHPTIEIVNGWRYRCFFADWSLYFPALLKKVQDYGVTHTIKKLNAGDPIDLPYDIILNCAGIGSVKLFSDQHDLILKGHLLNIPGQQPLVDPKGNRVSYNFSPGANVYGTESGINQDIYCYSRSDGWVFGGSRLLGNLSSTDPWRGALSAGKKLKIDGIDVPEQILRINLEVIKESFGFEPPKDLTKRLKVGYRYIRNTAEGLRLEAEELNNKLVIHNYGHGGAGVTLSWGCAQKCVELIERHV